MALRVPKAEPTAITKGIVEQFGTALEPVEVTENHPEVAAAALEFGARAGEWDAVEESLKSLAHMAVAAQVGCSWCLDFGYSQAEGSGLGLEKASQLPRWRESDAFTPLERDVLEYAEAMTSTPPTVSDELSARLLDQLGRAGLVELTVVIAFSNLSTRSNTALGVESQGFAAACEIPLAAGPRELAA